MAERENLGHDDSSRNEAYFTELMQRFTQNVSYRVNPDRSVGKFTSFAGFIDPKQEIEEAFTAKFLDAVDVTGRNLAFMPLILKAGDLIHVHYGTREATFEPIEHTEENDPLLFRDSFDTLASRFTQRDYIDGDEKGNPVTVTQYSRIINTQNVSDLDLLHNFQMKAVLAGIRSTLNWPGSVPLQDSFSLVRFIYRNEIPLAAFGKIGKLPPLRPNNRKAKLY